MNKDTKVYSNILRVIFSFTKSMIETIVYKLIKFPKHINVIY